MNYRCVDFFLLERQEKISVFIHFYIQVQKKWTNQIKFIIIFILSFISAHRACWFGEYKCDNGQCIQAYGVCNGQNDCIDGSDEKQCNPMGMLLWSWTTSLSSLILYWLFFLFLSLSLFDDDKNKDFVTCNQTGIRVHRSLWCDGRPDCSVFHEDELGCK